MLNHKNPLSFFGGMSAQATMSTVAAIAVLIVSLVFVSQRAEAAVAGVGFTPAVGGTDDVAGAAAADYNITLTAANSTATGIDVTFPAGYTIAAPGAAGITSSGCTTPATSEICIGGGTGNTAITGATTAGQVISIAFVATDLSAGAVTFTITTGVTNPTAAGAKAATGSTVTTTGGGGGCHDHERRSFETGTTQPTASTVAGVAIATQPIVTVQDAFGNTVTGDTSTVTLALTTGTGVLSGTLTKAAVAGVADFAGQALSINLVGADKVLTASDGGLTSAATGAFTITVAAASKLAVTTQPTASTVAGVAISTQPIVTVQDAFGNTITMASATSVTLALTTGTGALTGTVTKTAVSGIADFVGLGLKIDLAGTNKVLTASGGGYATGATSAFTITNAAASKLAFTTQPSARTAVDVAFAQQPIVTVQDAFGNTVVGDTSTVTLALTTGTGVLAGTLTKAAVAGVADFAGQALAIDFVGTDKVLTATDGGLTVATTSPPFAITDAAAAPVVEPDPVPKATDGGVTVTVENTETTARP